MEELTAAHRDLLVRILHSSTLTVHSSDTAPDPALPALEELAALELVTLRARDVRMDRLDGLAVVRRLEARLTPTGRELAARAAAEPPTPAPRPDRRGLLQIFRRGDR